MLNLIIPFAILFASSLVLTLTSGRNYYEANGIVSIEAEDYAAQALSDTRAWYRISKGDVGLKIIDRNRPAAAQHRFSGEAGSYALTLYTIKETDGESEYTVSINGVDVLKTTNATTSIDYSLHESHAKENVQLKQGDIIQVTSNAVTNGLIPEGDITAFSRGRWTELMLIPE